VSCSLLTSWLYSYNYLSYGDVIYSTSYLCSLSCVSCGVVIYGISIVCLVAYTNVEIAFTIVNSANGSTMLFIIFYAFKSMFSYSFFTPKPKAPPSSTLFFFLRTLIGKSDVAFFLISNVVYMSSLVLLTLVGGFCAFSF